MLENKKGKDLILHLLKSQMPSGGFPSKFHEETEGIRETCRNTLLLLRCGIPHDRLNIQSAVNYLLKYQRENGGWSENLDLTIPKEVVELSSAQGVTWLTADIIELLRNVGLDKSKLCTRALDWLRKMQNKDGGWRPFWTQNSDPTYTVLTLKLLVWLDAIDSEELEKQAAIYV